MVKRGLQVGFLDDTLLPVRSPVARAFIEERAGVSERACYSYVNSLSSESWLDRDWQGRQLVNVSSLSDWLAVAIDRRIERSQRNGALGGRPRKQP